MPPKKKQKMSSHKLEIERYRNIERSERKCTYCSANEIEDEYHFLLTCLIRREM